MASIILGAQRVQLLSKCMKMFDYLNDEVDIIWNPNDVSFQTINGFDTVFCDVIFQKEAFMEYQCEKTVYSKVSMHSLMFALGNRNSHLDVKVARIEFKPEDCRIMVEFGLENNKIRRIQIPIITDDVRPINFPRFSTKIPLPTFKCSAAVLAEIWQRFAPMQEIIMWFEERRILLKNFVDASTNLFYTSSITEYGLPIDKFNSYNVPNNFTTAFGLQDCLMFRQLASVHHNIISAYFQSDRPNELSFENNNEHYSGRLRFVSISLNDDYLDPPNVHVPRYGETQSMQSPPSDSLDVSVPPQSQLNQNVIPSQSNQPHSSPERTRRRTHLDFDEIEDIPELDDEDFLMDTDKSSRNIESSGTVAGSIISPIAPVSVNQPVFIEEPTFPVEESDPDAQMSNEDSFVNNDDNNVGHFDQIDQLEFQLDEEFSLHRSRANLNSRWQVPPGPDSPPTQYRLHSQDGSEET